MRACNMLLVTGSPASSTPRMTSAKGECPPTSPSETSSFARPAVSTTRAGCVVKVASNLRETPLRVTPNRPP